MIEKLTNHSIIIYCHLLNVLYIGNRMVLRFLAKDRSHCAWIVSNLDRVWYKLIGTVLYLVSVFDLGIWKHQKNWIFLHVLITIIIILILLFSQQIPFGQSVKMLNSTNWRHCLLNQKNINETFVLQKDFTV